MRDRVLHTISRARATPADATIAGLLFVALLIEVTVSSKREGAYLANVALLAGIAAPLAWRRTRPLAAIAVIATSAVALSAVLTSVQDLLTALVVMLLAAFSVAAYEPRGRALAGLAIAVATVAGVDIAGHGTSPSGYSFPMLLFASAWLLGRFMRTRMRVTEELRARGARLEREREELARAAVLDERARIARELHDVVAHNVSVMVVQAGAARRVLERSPEDSLAALAAVIGAPGARR